MKSILVKAVGSILILAAAIAAADPTYTRAGEVEIKRGGKDIRHPPTSLFATPQKEATAPSSCGACKSEWIPAVTQDTKLKTKTLLVERHLCTSCKTITAVAGSKADRSTTVKHSCKAPGATVACCGK